MYTYTYTQMYIHTAQQGRDEPPAGQCRMGVSMGYPPLTQKNSAKKNNSEKIFSSKKIALWKNLVKWLIFVLLIAMRLLFCIYD